VFTGLTIIAVECNWSKETLAPNLDRVVRERLYTSHFSLENVIKFLKANDLSKVHSIYLLHLSRDNADPEYFRSEIEKLTGKPVYIGGYE
jgi:phosphoribosyl 1,2-cyclic phosphodiesterase